MSLNSNRFNNFNQTQIPQQLQQMQQGQQQINMNQTGPINTNRLLLENDALTSKYNQYKQTLLKPFQSQTSNITNQQQDNLMSSSSNSINLNLNLNNNHNLNSNSPIKDTSNYKSPDLPLIKSLSNILLCNSFPEKDSDPDQLTQLKKEYDNRILSLYNNLRVVVTKIQTDDLITTMQNDINSSAFISSRIKEILDEDFYSEKETYIAKLSEENAALKAQMNSNMPYTQYQGQSQCQDQDDNYISKVKTLNVEQELQLKQMHQCLNEQSNQIDYLTKGNQSLHQINSDLNETIKKLTLENTRMRSDTSNYAENASSFEYEMNQANKTLDDTKKEIERLNKVISVIEIDLNSSEDIIKEKTSKNESLVKELTNIQNQLFDANLKLKKATDEKKSLQSLLEHYENERNELYAKCSTYNEDMQNSQKEKYELIEKKHKEKVKEIQQKMQSQKEVISTLESELTTERSKSESVKEQYSKMYKEMQENIKIVSREWEKKLKKEQEDFEHIIQELETKHTIEMNGLIRDNAIELESKQKKLNEYKLTIDQYKNIDKEFIKVSQHEEKMNKSIAEIKRQTEDDLSRRGEEIQRSFEDKLKKLSIEKKSEYDFIMQSLNSKQQLIENDNVTLKQINNTLKAKLESIRNEYSKVMIDNEKCDTMISQLSETIENNNKTIRSMKESKEELAYKAEQLEQSNNSLKKEIKGYKGMNSQYEALQRKANDMAETRQLLTKDNQTLLSKLQSCDAEYKSMEGKYNELIIQTSELNSDCELTRRDNLNYAKQLTSLAYNQRSHNDLMLNLLNSKVKAIKSELVSIKDYYRKEVNSVYKDTSNIIQSLQDKANRLLQSNQSLNGMNLSLNSKLKESQLKINELHTENSTLMHMNSKFKIENETLNSEIDNEKKEKAKLIQQSFQTESAEKNTLRETIKKSQSNLSNIVIHLVKVKKSYTTQITKFKLDIEDLCILYHNDLSIRDKQIESMNDVIERERREYIQLKDEYQSNSRNLSFIQTDFSKLKDIYENKIKLLNAKIIKSDQAITNVNQSIAVKTEQVEQLNTLLHESKTHNKSLKTQLEVKKNEMLNFKADFEKLMGLKDRKIKELQKIVNQSFSSYNSGVDDIHMAKKLDDEVKVLKQKAKNDETNYSLNYNKDKDI